MAGTTVGHIPELHVDRTFPPCVVLDSLLDTREPSVRVCGTLHTWCAVPACEKISASYAVPALSYLHHVWDRRKPRAVCAALGSSRTARILFHCCLLTIIRYVENTRNGDRSVARDRRLSVLAEIHVLFLCIENLVPVWSVDSGLYQNLGTRSGCPCIRFWVGEVFRYGLAVLPTCSKSHFRAVQPHHRTHDVDVIATATCPLHHLVAATFSEFRVSKHRVTLNHRWQRRPHRISAVEH